VILVLQELLVRSRFDVPLLALQHIWVSLKYDSVCSITLSWYFRHLIIAYLLYKDDYMLQYIHHIPGGPKKAEPRFLILR